MAKLGLQAQAGRVYLELLVIRVTTVPPEEVVVRVVPGHQVAEGLQGRQVPQAMVPDPGG
jgi:hypothetical protein